jgi:hypothetical protein
VNDRLRNNDKRIGGLARLSFQSAAI